MLAWALATVAGSVGSPPGGVVAESGYLLTFGVAGGLVVGAACVLGIRWAGSRPGECCGDGRAPGDWWPAGDHNV